MHKHYKGLMPIITSAAEAVVSDFYESVKERMHPDFVLSMRQFARLLMRHEGLSPHFANCLEHYMTSLDQTRGGRNPSYKQMSSVSTARFQSFKRFVGEFEALAGELSDFYRDAANEHAFFFHRYLVDWHGIAGQLPDVHRHFAPKIDNMALRRRRNPQDEEPWRVGRK